MVRDLGQTKLVREVERISQSHQKPTTKMILKDRNGEPERGE
jgi:hypothetical protein